MNEALYNTKGARSFKACRGRVAPRALAFLVLVGVVAAIGAVALGLVSVPGISEDVEAKTQALLDAGQDLQEGFSRILSAGVDFDEIVVDPTQTNDMTDLFAAHGGGVNPPPVTMAATPATDVWYYPLLAIPKLGSAAGSRMAVLHVSKAVCDAVNRRVNALPNGIASAQTADLGSFAAMELRAVPDWPEALAGRPVGCVGNKTNTGVPSGFYFYQAIGVR